MSAVISEQRSGLDTVKHAEGDYHACGTEPEKWPMSQYRAVLVPKQAYFGKLLCAFSER